MVSRPEEILVVSNRTQVPVSCSEVTEVMLLGGELCMSVCDLFRKVLRE